MQFNDSYVRNFPFRLVFEGRMFNIPLFDKIRIHKFSLDSFFSSVFDLEYISRPLSTSKGTTKNFLGLWWGKREWWGKSEWWGEDAGLNSGINVNGSFTI